ncbi:FecR domain-containing protein [Chitinophaga horti]|uniref:FecR domain-containing protein n=1 Tax=Chitinophaga horti TaxID=2920382 RepID=A0ABY6IYR5_9BACT|nr:FecR family protein [Chitinophaga horti]UYQ91149.1 FecR domain-containing protein [Chitinophaga horti]
MNRKIIERADELLSRILTETASPDDYGELLQLMNAHPEPWFVAHIQHYFSEHPKHVPGQLPSSYSPAWTQVLQNVLESDKPVITEATATRVRRMRTWWSVAAAAVVAVGTGIWLLRDQSPVNNAPLAVTQPVPAIEPGREGAVLTLADGSTMSLDSLGNGVIASQGGSKVLLQNGQLAYEQADGTAPAWNAITTPNARQFRLTLHDGTKVWLNAATVLRYPTAFKGGERKVELSGEAYFEVAKNDRQPFRVVVGDTATVEVLGTSFNVNAYHDEPAVRTTLLDGSVRMQKSKDAVLLRPGQQAVMQQIISIDKQANIEGAVAWKNGKFNFEGASLEEFTRQIARWYDIEVEYRGRTPKMQIKGKAGRDLQLQELLDGMAGFGIRYRLEGRKLIIL